MRIRKVLRTIIGCPGTRNDKTIISHNELVRGTHESALFEDDDLTLFEYNALGNIVKIKH